MGALGFWSPRQGYLRTKQPTCAATIARPSRQRRDQREEFSHARSLSESVCWRENTLISLPRSHSFPASFLWCACRILAQPRTSPLNDRLPYLCLFSSVRRICTSQKCTRTIPTSCDTSSQLVHFCKLHFQMSRIVVTGRAMSKIRRKRGRPRNDGKDSITGSKTIRMRDRVEFAIDFWAGWTGTTDTSFMLSACEFYADALSKQHKVAWRSLFHPHPGCAG